MTRLITLICVSAIALLSSAARSQTDTAFTYQGSLSDNGSPANGEYNIDISLWDALAGGNQIGSEIMYNGLAVSDGLLTVELDFGASAFDNTSRWIEISVNGTALSPRQPVTRSPYSIQTRGIVVDENSNVGIGTSTPLYPLHVNSASEYAIAGESQGSNGTGVYGLTTSNTGATYGVYGVSVGTSGRGVYGWATTLTGTTYGVQGKSDSVSGRGMYGWATAGTGTTDGVFGRSDSSSGRGIDGWASSPIGTTYGVYGTNDSTSGAGVKGEARATIGTTYGGQFESDSTQGSGVYGLATASSGITEGVFGRSESTSGRGVYGLAGASTGTTYGVYGTTVSSTGIGVYGRAETVSGISYAVRGFCTSSSGFDFFAAGPGTNYGSTSSRRWKHNIEPISDPLHKLAQLRGVYYDWDKEHGGQHDLGMIAEEVGEVLPEIVQYEENGVDAIGMDYSKMTPLLVEAVNALRAEIDAERAEMDIERAEKDAQIQQLNDRISNLERIITVFLSKEIEE
jgi:endosialidase-like protein